MADQNDIVNQQSQWHGLKQQAEAGEFHVDDEIGRALYRDCEMLIEGLKRAQTSAGDLGHLSGYGGLPSALALKKKFEQKATGGGGADPDDNAVARLQAHIDVAQLMSDTYRLATAALRSQDEANARRIVGL